MPNIYLEAHELKIPQMTLNTTALANGEGPGSLIFDQKEMRPHLIKCLEAVPVYCACHMPKKTGCKMIECSKCKHWFHVGMHVNVDSCALTK